MKWVLRHRSHFANALVLKLFPSDLIISEFIINDLIISEFD